MFHFGERNFQFLSNYLPAKPGKWWLLKGEVKAITLDSCTTDGQRQGLGIGVAVVRQMIHGFVIR